MFSNDDKKYALIKKTAEAITMLQNTYIYKKITFFYLFIKESWFLFIL